MFQSELFTCYFQFVSSDFSFQINPSSFLGVIHAAEARDIYYALLMHIHITSCEYKNGSDSYEKLIIWLHSKHWAKWKLKTDMPNCWQDLQTIAAMLFEWPTQLVPIYIL